ncbi:hypothetical protein PHOBOS_120 [Erwinia phage vB_EamM_Phobos]|uniref:hypothetical protein n=1 Tax=Erwinia phage vB_EamM_Phobos TaxID=1883377 RepID=UPI00081D0743|nr:hypothetical protein BIZ79_gp120 [Erwinia phage vB_EamM_Phobos]ANZ50310.1 hypothetical protein PHOBOS_120 [Erwinia phage vB_EamM_Phobos]
MAKYISWTLAEFVMFLVIGVGLLLAIVPALMLMVGYCVADFIVDRKAAHRDAARIKWRESRRAAAQRACGKRPN